MCEILWTQDAYIQGIDPYRYDLISNLKGLYHAELAEKEG